MSDNCITCVIRKRTSPVDGLCDRCRELARLKRLRDTPGPFGNSTVRWLIEQIEKQENLIYAMIGGVADLQRHHKQRCNADPPDIPPYGEAVIIGHMHKAIKEYSRT